jgi:hypothetical protein
MGSPWEISMQSMVRLATCAFALAGIQNDANTNKHPTKPKKRTNSFTLEL